MLGHLSQGKGSLSHQWNEEETIRREGFKRLFRSLMKFVKLPNTLGMYKSAESTSYLFFSYDVEVYFHTVQ